MNANEKFGILRKMQDMTESNEIEGAKYSMNIMLGIDGYFNVEVWNGDYAFFSEKDYSFDEFVIEIGRRL